MKYFDKNKIREVIKAPSHKFKDRLLGLFCKNSNDHCNLDFHQGSPCSHILSRKNLFFETLEKCSL